MHRLLALTVAVTACGAVRAAEPVKIGVVYPLSGPTAAAGLTARTAVEIGASIVNTQHMGLEGVPLAKGWGLANLQSARIETVVADTLDNMSVARSQVMRLVDHDRVAALIGSDDTPAGAAALAYAAARGVPCLVPDEGAEKPVAGTSQWVFRTAPTATDIAEVYSQFLGAVQAAGGKADTIALVHDTGARATAAARALGEALRAARFDVVGDIAYPVHAGDLSGPVQRLRDKRPDVAILSGNALDAALLVKTMKALDYRPPVLIGDGGGFAETGFVAAAGNLAQGLVDREVWRIGKPNSPTAIIAGIYRTRTGRDPDEAAARALQGFLVLADAIDRAGSAAPAAVREALQRTDLSPGQLIVGYRGVRFDDSGHNVLASTYLKQLQGKSYTTVWPLRAAEAAPPEREGGREAPPTTKR